MQTNSVKNGFELLRKSDPILYKITDLLGIPTYKSREASFENLTRIIIGQQLSGTAANTINARLKKVMGETFSPSDFISIDRKILRDCGISRAKIGFVQGLAKQLIDEPDFFSNLKKDSASSAIEKLKEIKGVGDWTSSIFAMFNLGHLDVFAKSDVSISKAIRFLYGEQVLEDASDFESLTSKWSPYKTLACLILWSWIDAGMPFLSDK